MALNMALNMALVRFDSFAGHSLSRSQLLGCSGQPEFVDATVEGGYVDLAVGIDSK